MVILELDYVSIYSNVYLQIFELSLLPLDSDPPLSSAPPPSKPLTQQQRAPNHKPDPLSLHQLIYYSTI